MSASVNHLKVDRDRGVPVGLFAGADVVVVTYADAGGELEPEPDDLLLIISIKLARILAIISAALSEPVVLGGGYRIHGSSGNHKFAKMPTHSRCLPTIHMARLTLSHRSLRRNGRRKRDGWEKKTVRMIDGIYFGNTTHWKTERRERRKEQLTR